MDKEKFFKIVKRNNNGNIIGGIITIALVLGILIPFITKHPADQNPFIFFGSLFIIFSFYLIGIGIYRKLNLYRHPLISQLKSYGNHVEDVIDNIILEINSPFERLTNNVRLTKSYLINGNGVYMQILPYIEVVWVYILETRKSLNAIPTGTDFTIQIEEKNGRKIKIHVGGGISDHARFEAKSDSISLIEKIKKRAPWAYYGYSHELYKYSLKNHPEFLKSVEDKKLFLMQGSGMESVKK